jgi:ABC-type nitrate/sulfonate/bicarbonate transport system substrate-binding protein
MRYLAIAGVGRAFAGPAFPADATEKVRMVLNGTPMADHSPFYYAKAPGWYEQAGIEPATRFGSYRHFLAAPAGGSDRLQRPRVTGQGSAR